MKVCFVSILTRRGKKSGMLCKDWRFLKLSIRFDFDRARRLRSDDIFAVRILMAGMD